MNCVSKYDKIAMENFQKLLDKKEFIPVQINASGKVNKVAYNGSGNIQALIAADGLMEFPMGKNRLEENERVRFISF